MSGTGHGPDNNKLINMQLAAGTAIALACAAVLFAVGEPFPPALAWLALTASAVYVSFLLLQRAGRPWNLAASHTSMGLTGSAILTAAIYLTGGILSPFLCLFFITLLSEAMYSSEKTYTLPALLAGYIGVTAGQYSGLLSQPVTWASHIYASLPATALIAGITVTYLVITSYLSHAILDNLRERISSESEAKDSMLRRFSELNATSQLGVLAHRIAHDLRGPIASVSGYLELEAARERTPEEAESLKDVTEAVEGMVASLHGITRFGKPGGSSCERVLLSDLMKNLVGIASFAPKARGVEFTVSDGEPGLSVTASRADLQQAFFNILKNAVEAVADNHDGRRVEIRIRREGRDAAVSICDNGPGIPEETLKDIFRKSVTTKADGTGVGLLITRDLLIRNKGDIKLRSGEGGGLAAVVLLPADQAAAPGLKG